MPRAPSTLEELEAWLKARRERTARYRAVKRARGECKECKQPAKLLVDEDGIPIFDRVTNDAGETELVQRRAELCETHLTADRKRAERARRARQENDK